MSRTIKYIDALEFIYHNLSPGQYSANCKCGFTPNGHEIECDPIPCGECPMGKQHTASQAAKWLKVQRTNQSKKDTNMKTNLKTLASMLLDPVVVRIRLSSSSDNKRYTYLCERELADTLSVDDRVLVGRSSIIGFNVGVVVKIDDEHQISPEDGIDYHWVLQRIDLTIKEERDELLNGLVKKLENSRKASYKQQALAALGIREDEVADLLKLTKG